MKKMLYIHIHMCTMINTALQLVDTAIVLVNAFVALATQDITVKSVSSVHVQCIHTYMPAI